MKVFLTGASGFVGHHILEALSVNHEVTCFGRRRPKGWEGDFVKGQLEGIEATSINLRNVDSVIHSAARAHIMQDNEHNPLDEYRKINTVATIELAKQAAAQGVKRFVFISSIKVSGEATTLRAFTADGARDPQDDYGLSKSEAEMLLLQLAEKTEMEVVIIRPPLIYGPGVKANFASLYKLAGKGWPLPLGCITDNRRSLVSVYNLLNFIEVCLVHPSAGNQVFHVSDGQDVSTRKLVELLASAQDKKILMLPVPIVLFELAGRLTGRLAVIERLTSSLQVDIHKNERMLNWTPPFTIEQSLTLMGKNL
ncbi:NAD-dependent epimerase/dehydratase family protein [Vibrio sp. 10N.222.51.C12]|uniref:NAD-dependent epimerase/dehydratase family protein n=1 Tax=Vibrio sp. 10N.222.51.C12 TaxID=3229622 RepID=UPI0035527B8C